MSLTIHRVEMIDRDPTEKARQALRTAAIEYFAEVIRHEAPAEERYLAQAIELMTRRP